jgi:hypothetical protein
MLSAFAVNPAGTSCNALPIAFKKEAPSPVFELGAQS